jgi:hypothetical protein
MEQRKYWKKFIGRFNQYAESQSYWAIYVQRLRPDSTFLSNSWEASLVVTSVPTKPPYSWYIIDVFERVYEPVIKIVTKPLLHTRYLQVCRTSRNPNTKNQSPLLTISPKHSFSRQKNQPIYYTAYPTRSSNYNNDLTVQTQGIHSARGLEKNAMSKNIRYCSWDL